MHPNVGNQIKQYFCFQVKDLIYGNKDAQFFILWQPNFAEWLKNNKYTFEQVSLAGTVIKDTGTLRFKDGLRTGVLQEHLLVPLVAALF